MVFADNRRKIALEYADLVQEQEACKKQYRSAIDEAERVRLRRKIDNLENEIHNLECQLYEKDLTSEDANRRSRALENKLSKIDFKEQVETVQSILDEFTEYGAALFFINDYLKMAGDLFFF